MPCGLLDQRLSDLIELVFERRYVAPLPSDLQHLPHDVELTGIQSSDRISRVLFVVVTHRLSPYSTHTLSGIIAHRS